MKRRDLAVSSLVAGTMIVAGALAPLVTASAQDKPFDGVTLRVATWGGSWKQNIEKIIVPKFEKLGGSIEFVTGSPQASLAKLIAARGNAPFDVMEILDAQENDFLNSDFLQPIDFDAIPNKTHLDPWQYAHPTLIGSWFTQETICYNADKFRELGLPTPTTYRDLIDPRLEGRISIPDINSGGGIANFGAIVHAAGGDETNVKPGLDLITKLKALKFWSRGGEVVTQFSSGDIYAAIAHAGWCVRARKAGNPVKTVHPRIDDQHTGVMKYGWLGILKSSPNAKAANWFLNQYLDADFQYEFAIKSGVVPVNQLAQARLGEDPILKELLVLDPALIKKELRLDYSKVNISDWTDQWSRSVAR